MLNLDMKSIIEYLKCTWLKYTQNDRLSSHTASAYFDRFRLNINKIK